MPMVHHLIIHIMKQRKARGITEILRDSIEKIVSYIVETSTRLQIYKLK